MEKSSKRAEYPGSIPGRRIPHHMNKQKASQFYDKYYKTILIIPALLLIFSLAYLGYFYQTTGDIMLKDITLTGGSSITVYGDLKIDSLPSSINSELENVEVIQLYDIITQKNIGILIETTTPPEEAKQIVETIVGYKLTDDNSSVEFTGPLLSAGFYNQLITAIIVAFLLMCLVVFIIFGESREIKIYASILTLMNVAILFQKISSVRSLVLYILLPILFIILFVIPKKLTSKWKWQIFAVLIVGYISLFFYPSIITLILFSIALLAIYILFSIPSLAVILAAFTDMVMTLAIVDLLGIKISSAGIVAFLMLIGYSVDTDIMLTNRIIRRTGEGSVNHHMFGAFKTGMSMTMTAILAVTAGLVLTFTLSKVLSQIFTIVLIGLFLDIFNTWITNACLLKWYVDAKEKRK